MKGGQCYSGEGKQCSGAVEVEGQDTALTRFHLTGH